MTVPLSMQAFSMFIQVCVWKAGLLPAAADGISLPMAPWCGDDSGVCSLSSGRTLPPPWHGMGTVQ